MEDDPAVGGFRGIGTVGTGRTGSTDSCGRSGIVGEEGGMSVRVVSRCIETAALGTFFVVFVEVSLERRGARWTIEDDRDMSSRMELSSRPSVAGGVLRIVGLRDSLVEGLRKGPGCGKISMMSSSESSSSSMTSDSLLRCVSLVRWVGILDADRDELALDL